MNALDGRRSRHPRPAEDRGGRSSRQSTRRCARPSAKRRRAKSCVTPSAWWRSQQGQKWPRSRRRSGPRKLQGDPASVDEGRRADRRGALTMRRACSTSTSRAAATPKPIVRWVSARSATSCPATGTAHSARATIRASSLPGRKRLWAARAIATSATAPALEELTTGARLEAAPRLAPPFGTGPASETPHDDAKPHGANLREEGGSPAGRM